MNILEEMKEKKYVGNLNVILICKQKKWIKKLKNVLDKIEQQGKIDVILLIVHPQDQREYDKDYICVKNVVTSLDLEFHEGMMGINYDIIEQFRKSQLKIENHNYRLYDDYQLDKYYYYAALSYWQVFFAKNNVDLVINIMSRHGYPWELALDIADALKIKTICYEVCAYNDTYQINSRGMLQAVQCRNVYDVDYLLNSSYDRTQLPSQNLQKGRLAKFFYQTGGNLLEDFMYRLVKNDWRPRSILHFRYSATWWEKMQGYLQMRKIAKYAESISVFPNYGEKYIFYALHFEPEATIITRPILENQLVVIKMLSDALPKGWYLYVKEHPAQYNVNNDKGYYFMREVPRFKSKRFYSKIHEFSNVKLISAKIKSEKLIEKSQAVASIMGTVLWEAVQIKKNVLVFSDLQVVSMCKDAFSIHSYDELARAIAKIEQGFTSDYDDVSKIINKYVLREDDISNDIVRFIEKI